MSRAPGFVTHMLVVDASEIQKLAEQLDKTSKKALPYAMRESLNRSAFAARNVWKGEIEESMTLRNSWTTRTLQVVKASGAVGAMQSSVGSTERYMALQERGGTKTKRGAHGVAIPTKVASGEGRGGGVRQRLVRGPNKLSAIRLGNRPGGSRRQRNAAAIRMAKAAGRKFVFLELEKHMGLFRISGGTRRTQLDMVWETSRSSVRIPPNPTLQRTLTRLEPHLPAIHLGVLREQLHRAGVLGF